MNEFLRNHSDMIRLNRAINRLRVVSHKSASILERSAPSTDQEPGGKRPTGNIDIHGDLNPDYRQKSHVFFLIRRQRLHTAAELTQLADDAEAAVVAWMKTPTVSGVDPEPGSFRWKCLIADDDRPLDQIVAHFVVSRATVFRYRQRYRGVLRGRVDEEAA